MPKYTLLYSVPEKEIFDDIDDLKDYIEENGLDETTFQRDYLLFKGEPLKVSIEEVHKTNIEIIGEP